MAGMAGMGDHLNGMNYNGGGERENILCYKNGITYIFEI